MRQLDTATYAGLCYASLFLSVLVILLSFSLPLSMHPAAPFLPLWPSSIFFIFFSFSTHLKLVSPSISCVPLPSVSCHQSFSRVVKSETEPSSPFLSCLSVCLSVSLLSGQWEITGELGDELFEVVPCSWGGPRLMMALEWKRQRRIHPYVSVWLVSSRALSSKIE